MAILVIEDDDATRESVRDALTAEGYDVETACNALEALPILRASPPPDVIVLDLRGTGGEELRRAQLSDPRLAEVPTVIMTAARAPTLDDGVELLKKPFALDDLFVALSTAAQRHEQRRAG